MPADPSVSSMEGARPDGPPRAGATLRAVSRFSRWPVRSIRSGVRGRSFSALALYASMPALSGLNAVVGLVLPMLLGPLAFGRYSLAVTLFQYALIFDFGLAQTIDRRIPVLLEGEPARRREFVAEVLGLRLGIAALVMAGGGALLAALDTAGWLPFAAIDGALALAAGLCFMLALGPMSVWRASAARRDFALWNGVCSLGLAVARPIGILLGGITGSFALLLACYAAVAVVLPRRMPRAVLPTPRRAARLLADSLPLFLTSILWAVYMTANRWVVSFVAPPLPLGQFAFGANVLALVVGTVAAISQLYYPAVAIRVAAGPRGGVSAALLRDLCALAGIGLAIGAAGIVAGPFLIELLYRHFAGAEIPMRILMAALPSLLVCSWLVPLGLATAARPWREAGVTLPLALLGLAAATWGGYRIAGIAGSAWGSALAAPLLLALLLGVFGRNGVMAWRHAGLLFAAVVAATAALAALAA